MATHDFTTVVTVNASAQAAFDAITRPREWWGKDIQGAPDSLGDEWTYRYKDLHSSRQKTTDLAAGQRVVWQVTDSTLSFLQDKSKWTGTSLVFDIAEKGDKTEIRFTHAGLVPDVECFDVCSSVWIGLIQDSLRQLIETGTGRPDTVE